MAQDQPPPDSDQPQNDAAPRSGAGLDRRAAPGFPFRNRLLLVRDPLLRLLRGTVQVLEGAIAQLEAVEPEAATPSADLQKQLRSGLQTLRTWAVILRNQIRTRLPAPINRRLTDSALAGAIVGILLLGLWTVTALLPDQAPELTQLPAPQLTPQPAPLPVPTSPPEEVLPDRSLSETPSPVLPQPVAPSPQPTPPAVPALKLNPEQKLITAIQTQVAEISDRYARGLIQAVEANFQGSQLILQVSKDWYALSSSQQDQLAAEMLQRSRDLDFNTLKIVDQAGTRLARSPVVGTEMVILKRYSAAAPA